MSPLALNILIGGSRKKLSAAKNMENNLPEILLNMSDEEKLALAIMEWEMGKYYLHLEEIIKLPKYQLKKIIKKLKDLNLISVGSLVDIDGERGGYFGRGWTLTGYGMTIQNTLLNQVNNLSKCCGNSVIIGGKTTHYYICRECGKICDLENNEA